MKYDLFDPQTVQANACPFRMVFRNWGNKYALQILKA